MRSGSLRPVFAFLFLVLTLQPADGQASPGQNWAAEWIACPDAPARDEGVFHFRKRIVLAERPSHLAVEVSADNQFILFVNGERAGSGPARGDLNHWRFESIDIAPFLHEGVNWIGATVWNFGVRAPIAQVSDRTGFYLNTFDSKYSMVDTNPTWQVEREAGIETLPIPPAIARFYYAAEPATRTDGRLYDWSWETMQSKGAWQKAFSLELGGLRDAIDLHVNWRFVPDGLPPMERTLSPSGRVVRASGIAQAKGFPQQALTIPAHTKASLLIDAGELTTAYPELTVSMGAGALVRLTYTEALKDKNGVKGNRNEIAGKTASGIYDEFLPDGTDGRDFAPLVWRTWRYLQIDIQTGSSPLRLDSLRTWFTAYPFVERGGFRSSDDPSLEKIWKIGWRTARLDAHTTYMDSCYWEQMQYVGDTRIQALISYAASGDDRLAKQAIEAINNTRLPEGITLSRGPASLFQAIPTFSLFWVNMVHDFWMYHDDPQFTREQLDGTRAVLAWFLSHVRANGLVGKLPWWPFVDWSFADNGVPPGEGEGSSAIITLQLVSALRDGAEIESALGSDQLAREYRQAADRSAQSVRQLCWNRTLGLLADTPKQNSYSQETNAFGVWLDVIPPEEQQTALTKVLSATDPVFKTNVKLPPITAASFYFRFYVARALDHAGMGDLYTRMLAPWQNMMALGLTTWAEIPEPSRSDCHAWSASPTYDLLTIAAGIRPAAPGFRKVRIEPHLGLLNHLTAQMPHPKGMIEVEYTRSRTGVAANITLPAAVDGELVWLGHTYPLHAGKQTLDLPPQ